MESSQSKSADYFGTFLDTLASGEEAERSGESNDNLQRILLSLADAPLSVIDLQRNAELGLDDVMRELDAARFSGYVQVVGPKTQEVVALTDSGRELATRLKHTE